jgi:hypothetical protein
MDNVQLQKSFINLTVIKGRVAESRVLSLTSYEFFNKR